MFLPVRAITPALVLLAAVFYVRADPNPTGPGPGDIFVQGQPCTISWNADPTGSWKTMSIELMTGNNFDMTSLMAVTHAVDATDPRKNTYSYTCPQVSPHSAIYFYQFSSPSSGNKTWTGRFAITDASRDVTPPSESTQPGGERIPWGTGSLVKETHATPSGARSRAVNSSVSGVPTSARSTASGTPLPSSNATTSAGRLGSSASATPTTDYTVDANGAAGMLSASGIFFQTALALGLAALGFIAMS